MSLLRSISTIAGSSVLSQVIGAVSLWLISHRYGMGEVGVYALTYSIVLIGAQGVHVRLSTVVTETVG